MKRPGKKQKQDPRQAAFVKAYRLTYSITEAAELVGVTPGVHYDWLRDDPKYAATFAIAEPEARRRALQKRPAFLNVFKITCNVTESARRVGLARTVHYDWLRDDPAYKTEFEAAIKEAAGSLEDDAIQWARVGLFDPLVYKGEFRYARRKRVMCQLADGTSAFEDELKKPHAKILERRTVMTADGEQLGVYRRSEGLMGRLLAAWMPEKYGSRPAVDLNGKVEITDPEDARRDILRKLAGIVAARRSPEPASEP